MRRTHLWLVAATSFLAVAGLAPSAAAEELYLRLNHGALFSRCGIEVKAVGFAGWPGRFAGGGVSYKFGEPVWVYGDGVSFGPGYVECLSVAVYASIDDARRAFDYKRWIVPMPSAPPPEDQRIGDEMLWSYSRERSSDTGGTITWRRGNIVVTLRKRGNRDQVVGLARQIDALIRDDRQIAPRGRFAETPEIVSVKAPQRATKDSRVWVTPVFRGLGDPNDLRIGIYDIQDKKLSGTTWEGKSDPEIMVERVEADGVRYLAPRERRMPEEDGRFEVSIPPTAKPGPLELTMIAGTPDNLIVTKNFTITVVDE